MMNWNLVSEKWTQLSSQVKSQWDKITDEDLKEIDGSQEALTAKLQERYGFLRMDAEKKVAEWGDQVSGDLENGAHSPNSPAFERAAAKRRSSVGTAPPTVAQDGEEPEPDQRLKLADKRDPEEPTSKLTPPLDRKNETRDRASQSAADNKLS